MAALKLELEYYSFSLSRFFFLHDSSLSFLMNESYILIHFFPEFLEVGKKQPALDVLYDVMKSKKHRTWQKIHEPIMLKYLELCVDLRKSHLAKEGLYQYKNICQQVKPLDSLNSRKLKVTILMIKRLSHFEKNMLLAHLCM